MKLVVSGSKYVNKYILLNAQSVNSPDGENGYLFDVWVIRPMQDDQDTDEIVLLEEEIFGKGDLEDDAIESARQYLIETYGAERNAIRFVQTLELTYEQL